MAREKKEPKRFTVRVNLVLTVKATDAATALSGTTWALSKAIIPNCIDRVIKWSEAQEVAP